MSKTKDPERSMLPLPTELYLRLQKIARLHNRPVSWEAREILEEGIQSREEKLKKGEK